MSLIGQYIAKNLIKSIGLVALIFCGLLLLTSLLSQLKDMGVADYGIVQAVFYVILKMPNLLYDFSPIIILLGSMLSLGSLSISRELSVMRTSGYSTQRILRVVLGSGLMIISLMSLIGECFGPHLSAKAEIHKENAQHGGQAVITSTGVWFHIDNNFIHVKQVVGRQLLEGVTRYQFDHNHRLRYAYYAKTLAMRDNTWILHDVVKTTFSEMDATSETFQQLEWDLKFNANLLNVGLVFPSEMSLGKLFKYAQYLKKNGLQATEYQFNFWQRIFKPLSALMMLLLALPFVLSAVHLGSLGFRLFAGVIIGFVFYILNALLGQIAVVYQVIPWVAALLPIVLFSTSALILSKKLLRS